MFDQVEMPVNDPFWFMVPGAVIEGLIASDIKNDYVELKSVIVFYVDSKQSVQTQKLHLNTRSIIAIGKGNLIPEFY